jgi:hypothetical protein
MEITAVGPTFKYLDDPKRAYANKGKIETYIPTCGGKPASNA